MGEKFYHLHAFLLARASLFFESHMSIAARTEQGNAKGSDLTEVLPGSCHTAFEDALDFMYSENQANFEAPASKAGVSRPCFEWRFPCASAFGGLF